MTASTQSVPAGIDLRGLYRMPWSMSDNAFSWLEPTRHCDLACEYCYQVHDPHSHKSVEQFTAEVDGLLRLRRTDAVLIAGGEPLTHPKIVEMVKIVCAHPVKAFLQTNGHALTAELVRELKAVGIRGFLLHVDSHQNRPGWQGCSEDELNTLRQQLADMIRDAGGLACGFTTTIVPETLREVGDIFRWTIRNIDRVQVNVFIPVRQPRKDEQYDYFLGRRRVAEGELPLPRGPAYRDMTAAELLALMRKVLPGFAFNAYLPGTLRDDVPKWLFANNVGTRRRIYGHLGPRAMRLVQSVHHLAYGRYLSFLRPWQYRTAQQLFALAPLDAELRLAARAYLADVARDPGLLFRRLHVQTIVLMQPHDILPDGRQDLCDGCPNKTFWRGRLVSECRMEEYLHFGAKLEMKPKETPPEAQA